MKPILFSTEMVRAILDGRKSMTRRVIRQSVVDRFVLDSRGNLLGSYTEEAGDAYPTIDDSPYQPGDILWVQETWKVDSLLRDDPSYPMAIDFKAVQDGYSHAEVMCKFTPGRFDKFEKFYQKPGWQSPYFMPREAARIFLRVTDVRAERVQEITEEDAWKEGCPEEHIPDKYPRSDVWFYELWQTLNAKRGYGWYANPWVWAISFERISKEEAERSV